MGGGGPGPGPSGENQKMVVEGGGHSGQRAALRIYGDNVEARTQNSRYVAGIRRYLGVVCRRPDLGVRGALEETILQVVWARHYEGP